MDGLTVATNERSTEIYPFDVVLFGLQVCNLTNVVTTNRTGQPFLAIIPQRRCRAVSPYRVQETPGHIRWFEDSVLAHQRTALL